jgi:vitamin B12 transporter
VIRFTPAVASLLATAAQAQQGDIVVTGRGLEAGLGEDSYDVSIIGRDRLAHAPSNRLEDVLRDVPGFQQFRRSDSRSANPTSQGVTLRALGGNASARALLILDGVPQIDPFGGWIAWPAYDPRRLGRIRVTRGGGSGAAGPGALSGTIELESLEDRGPGGVAADLAYGSSDAIEAFAGYRAPLGPGFVSFSAAYAGGDGFVPVIAEQRGSADRRAPYEQMSLALRGVAPIGGASELQAALSAFRDERERGTAFSAIETRGADASLRLVGRGRLPFSLLAYVQSRAFSNEFAAANAARSAASPTLDQFSVPSTGLGARGEIRPRLGSVELRLGADWRATSGRTHELFQFVAGAPTRMRSAGGRSDTLGAFAEAGWAQGPVTLTGGVRLDHWRLTDGGLHERVLATGAQLTDVGFPVRGGWEPTARAGASWRAAEALTLRAAFYLGWRLPTLNELYRPFRLGLDATAANAALAPERLQGIEAGLEVRPARTARVSVTLFANRLTGAIANVTLGAGPGTFPGVGFVAAGGSYRMRENLDAIVSKGIEIDASADFGRLRLAAGYSFADAEVGARGTALPLDGLRPAQTPRHSLTARLSWTGPAGASATAGARYVSGQFEDDLNRQRIPGALTFDALAEVPLTARLALQARGENLGGERVVAGISGAGIVERATPRTFWIGLRWRG